MLLALVLIESFLSLEAPSALITWEVLLLGTSSCLVVLCRRDHLLSVLWRLAMVTQLLSRLVDRLANLALEDLRGSDI